MCRNIYIYIYVAACWATIHVSPWPRFTPFATWLNKMSTQMLVIEMRARWQLFAFFFRPGVLDPVLFMGLPAGDCVFGSWVPG